MGNQQPVEDLSERIILAGHHTDAIVKHIEVEHSVISRRKSNDIKALATPDDVITFTTIEKIVPKVANEQIPPAPTEELVVPGSSSHLVVPGITLNHIVS